MATQTSDEADRLYPLHVSDPSLSLEILKNESRCIAVEYLATAEDTVSMSELVDHVVEKKDEQSESEDTHRRAKVRFHHVHLPKMEDADLLHFDTDHHTITPMERIQQAALSLKGFALPSAQ
ncbi:DUF7344 domain-containing protein [Halorientalis halophila]|uniref:DUF7344 domain-containing protein n=1 Tax=Halorientalis halophila TaxID=3108499 RepID=UPI00300BF95C